MTLYVLGPEASGTRWVSEVFRSCGVEVCRRSYPYGPTKDGLPRRMPSLEELLGESDGLPPRAIVTSRDWWAMIHSQVRAGHVPTVEEAEVNVTVADATIWGLLSAMHPTPIVAMVSIEAAAARPTEHLQAIAAALGLAPLGDFPPPDASVNDRYYIDQESGG